MGKLTPQRCANLRVRIREAEHRVHRAEASRRGVSAAHRALERMRMAYLTGACSLQPGVGAMDADGCRDKAGKWVPVPACRGHYIPRSGSAAYRAKQEEEAMRRRRKRRSTAGLSCGCGMSGPEWPKSKCDKSAEAVARLMDEGRTKEARKAFQTAAAKGCGAHYDGLGRRLGSKKRRLRRKLRSAKKRAR